MNQTDQTAMKREGGQKKVTEHNRGREQGIAGSGVKVSEPTKLRKNRTNGFGK